MAAQDVEDFLEADDLLNQNINFPPEVIAAIDQVLDLIALYKLN